MHAVVLGCNPGESRHVGAILRRRDFVVTSTRTLEKALTTEANLYVVDDRVDGHAAQESVAALKTLHPQSPVVVLNHSTRRRLPAGALTCVDAGDDSTLESVASWVRQIRNLPSLLPRSKTPRARVRRS